MQEFFGEYINIITGLSVGTVAMIGWRLLAFFKKDKYLLPFVNIAKVKATETFGSANVEAFVKEAKDIKISEIKPAIKVFAQKINNLETLLKVLMSNQLALGVYDDNPELKEMLEKLL